MNYEREEKQDIKRLYTRVKLDSVALQMLDEFYINTEAFESEDKEKEFTQKVEIKRQKLLEKVAYPGSIFEKNPIKKLVSKKKIRFEIEGYDLDLTYITDRIIAMGYPADNIEKVYRNPLSEVKDFFTNRHGKNYKVYNLCSEREYAPDTFANQSRFPFDDHEAPPIDLMMTFCKDADKFLRSDNQNVIAIHCKAGKGRTGLMLCCYLIYSGFVDNAEHALKYYGIMRTTNGKGVTIQSQIRYLFFFEEILKRNIPQPLNSPELKLKAIRFNSAPNLNLLSSGSCPFFEIKNGDMKYCYDKNNTLTDFYKGDKVEFIINEELSLKNDFLITFYNYRIIGKLKLFKIWFNTYFVPYDGNVCIKREFLDMKLGKKELDEKYGQDFKVDLIFEMTNNNQDDSELFKDINSNNFDFYK